jgi:dTDP-4-amino-4,6-dideoxygalactose transaminase
MFIPYNLQKFIKKEKNNNCPKANKIAFNSFYLPSGVDLKDKDIRHISDCLNKMI